MYGMYVWFSTFPIVSMVNMMSYRFYILVFISLKHWLLGALLCVDLLLSGSGLYQLLHSTVQPGNSEFQVIFDLLQYYITVFSLSKLLISYC